MFLSALRLRYIGIVFGKGCFVFELLKIEPRAFHIKASTPKLSYIPIPYWYIDNSQVFFMILVC
jgi:hypothetical protein